MPKSSEECLTGSFLYGDDFAAEAVERWFHSRHPSPLEQSNPTTPNAEKLDWALH
jgi:hypothetical protein